jgi:hypothetical protein
MSTSSGQVGKHFSSREVHGVRSVKSLISDKCLVLRGIVAWTEVILLS